MPPDLTREAPKMTAPINGPKYGIIFVKNIINDKNIQSVFFIDLTPFKINYIILHSLTFF